MAKKHTNKPEPEMSAFDTKMHELMNKHWKVVAAALATAFIALAAYEVLT